MLHTVTRTMAVVANDSRSNTTMDNKGQCPAKESILLLLGLVFTHGKDLLQYFLDIFIHLALGNSNKTHSLEPKFSPGTVSPREWDGWLGLAFPTIFQRNVSPIDCYISTKKWVKERALLFPLGNNEAGSTLNKGFLGSWLQMWA